MTMITQKIDIDAIDSALYDMDGIKHLLYALAEMTDNGSNVPTAAPLYFLAAQIEAMRRKICTAAGTVIDPPNNVVQMPPHAASN